MPLTVENGTGLADADSYVSLSDFKAYCDARGLDRAALLDPEAEAKLRQAASYIDTIQRYKGSRLLATQALEFPRSGLTDWGGHAVTGVPLRVKHAACELVIKAKSESLYTDADRGGMVKSEAVGPISVTYMDGAPAEKRYSVAMKLLEQYAYGGTIDMTGPTHETETEGYFSLGMHDSPEASADG